MLIDFWDVMGKLAIKGLYGNLTFKEEKNLIKLEGWSKQDFKRKFEAEEFMESDF